jgi:anti-anti-sigma regulatory factor
MTDFVVWLDKGVALVEPSGALNADTAGDLRAALSEAGRLTREALVAMVDDKTVSVDQVAAAVLLSEHRRLQALGGTLAVVGPRGPIALLLHGMCVGDEPPAFTSLEQALAELTTRRAHPR